MKSVVFFVLLVLLGSSLPVVAQTTPTAPPTAKPYSDDEFPPWVRKLRRAEIIAVGAFPIAYMISGVGYDYYYYWANGAPSDNIPWPLGPGTSLWTTSSNGADLDRKNLTVLATSAVIGIAIATVDWFLSP